MVSWLSQHRTVTVCVFDATAWVMGYVVFAWLWFDRVSVSVPWLAVLALSAATAVAYLFVGWVSRLHLGRARTASLEEMLLLGV